MYHSAASLPDDCLPGKFEVTVASGSSVSRRDPVVGGLCLGRARGSVGRPVIHNDFGGVEIRRGPMPVASRWEGWPRDVTATVHKAESEIVERYQPNLRRGRAARSIF